MAHEIIFSPEARDDLEQLYLYVAEHSSDATALSYIRRIRIFCHSFADFPLRGMSRDDLAPGLRIVGFERRISIAFHVENDAVTFDRFLYGGRDVEAEFGKD